MCRGVCAGEGKFFWGVLSAVAFFFHDDRLLVFVNEEQERRQGKFRESNLFPELPSNRQSCLLPLRGTAML